MTTVDKLTIEDLRKSPVWQYAPSRGGDGTRVRPVSRTPVANLSGKIVGTEVVLANGKKAWALLGSVDAKNPRLTAHSLTISMERDGRWFHLARYHDFDYGERGPEHLAAFLGLAEDEVFPISYDLRDVVKGDSRVLKSVILARPAERLTREEIIALAVP